MTIQRILFYVPLAGALALLSWAWVSIDASNAANKEQMRVADIQRKVESDLYPDEIQASVHKMVQEHVAVAGWERRLTGDGVRTTPVTAIELEGLWISSRPILFVGKITGVAERDASSYSITIEDDSYRMLTNLRLLLVADKEPVDRLFEQFPLVQLGAPVAVVARVGSVGVETTTAQNGRVTEVGIGLGQMIDAEYTGIGGYEQIIGGR